MFVWSLLLAGFLKNKYKPPQQGSALIDALIATVVAALVFVSTATTLNLASRIITKANRADAELRELHNLIARIQAGAVSLDDAEYHGWSISSEQFSIEPAPLSHDDPLALLKVTIKRQDEPAVGASFIYGDQHSSSQEGRF